MKMRWGVVTVGMPKTEDRKNARLGVFCFDYISFGTINPIKSIVFNNVSRATFTICSRPARTSDGVSSRRIGQL